MCTGGTILLNTDTSMKVAIYARVSTEDQTTENQTQVLAGYAKQRGYSVWGIYQENESAWKKGQQKELKRLMADAHTGKFDIVLVWALDRLTRGGALEILQLVDKLKNRGVRVLSYQEIWTEAPGEIADILYAITGWVARMESERRSERTKAGLERAKAQGKTLGRKPGSTDKQPRKKTGYQKRWLREAEAREKFGTK